MKLLFAKGTLRCVNDFVKHKYLMEMIEKANGRLLLVMMLSASEVRAVALRILLERETRYATILNGCKFISASGPSSTKLSVFS